jgi:membrane-bound ClpP family serine protease
MLLPSSPSRRPVAAQAGAACLPLVLALALSSLAAPCRAAATDRGACWRIPVEGALDGDLVEQTQRRVRRAVRAGAGLLVLELSCGGGRLDKAHELGAYLAGLGADRHHPVETVAFVTSKSRDLAMLPALGCARIVMQKQDEGGDEDDTPREAQLGGFGPYLDKHPKAQDALCHDLLDLASRHDRPAAIMLGAAFQDVRVVEVERAEGGRSFVAVAPRRRVEQIAALAPAPATSDVVIADDRFEADQQGPKLHRIALQVKPWQGQPQYADRHLTLSADQARQVGVASGVVKDFDDLCASLGVSPSEVRSPEPDWLDRLAGILEHPVAAGLLILVGLTCLLLEFRTRGIGVPGFVAAVCLVLFFWAHAQASGRVDWLAVVLFALALPLLTLEASVQPGYRACGVGGILLLLAGLGLGAYGHWPRAAADWLDFGRKLLPAAVGTLGSLGCAYLLVKHLRRIPILNRLAGKPSEEPEAPQQEAAVPAANRELLGATGFAATPLRPTGKAQFEKTFVDVVVAGGGEVMPGTRVRVVEVEADRVVVKEV